MLVLLFGALVGGGLVGWMIVRNGGGLKEMLAALQQGPNQQQPASTEKEGSTELASGATAKSDRNREVTETKSRTTREEMTTAPTGAGETARTQTTPTERPKETKKTDSAKSPPPPPVASSSPAALVISVHNYLYANPISPGDPGGRTINKFVEALSPGSTSKGRAAPGLNIDKKQVQHLSDVPSNDSPARPPLKQTIEAALANFLKAARPQDHLLVVFVGHSAEIDGQAYLAPIEGELDNAASLIPLRTVLDQLAKCPAQEKVLVLDVNQVSPTKMYRAPRQRADEREVRGHPQVPPCWHSDLGFVPG